MMKYRILAKTVKKAIKSFPALVLTGPRQSGKTTLLKSLLKDSHEYFNLEDPDTRVRAKADPRGFIDQCAGPVIFDEIQYVPELLSYIKTRIDAKRKPGFWILTGSQNFSLMHGVSESLAGRVAVLSLLPFSLAERTGRGQPSLDMRGLLNNLPARPGQVNKNLSIADFILRGNYPEIASRPSVNRELWCGSYISTYLERDIRNLSQVGDLNQFERFLRLCATRTGQILNISELAREIGISVPTGKRWISMLETGYQVLLLYPYYKNIGKRLIKSPKIYFNDTALACYLLGIRDSRSLLASPYFPHLFETMVITDFWKRYLNHGGLPSLYYLRTRDGLEIDLVIELNQKLHLFEIKSSATIFPKHAASLIRAGRDLPDVKLPLNIISQSSLVRHIQKDVNNYNWPEVLLL